MTKNDESLMFILNTIWLNSLGAKWAEIGKEITQGHILNEERARSTSSQPFHEKTGVNFSKCQFSCFPSFTAQAFLCGQAPIA